MLVWITRALLKFAAWKRQVQIILGEKHEWLHNSHQLDFSADLFDTSSTRMDFTSSLDGKFFFEIEQFHIFFLSQKTMIEMLFFHSNKMKWYEREKNMMLIKRCDSERNKKIWNCTNGDSKSGKHSATLHMSGEQKKWKNCRQQQPNWFTHRINRFTCFQLACRWQSFAFSCHALACYANECLWWCDNAKPLPMM